MQKILILLCWCITYRDELNNDVNETIDTGNYRINNYKTTRSISFEYKTKIIRKASATLDRLNTKVVVSLN